MSAATVIRGTGRPAPSYIKEHRACVRCGLVRKMQRREQQFCIDCRHYARADGWVES